MAIFYHPPGPFTGGRQPYDNKDVPPSIEAVPVDNPPSNHRARGNFYAIVQAWQSDNSQTSEPPWPFQPFMGAWQPLDIGKMPPSLLAAAVSPPIPNINFTANVAEILATWNLLPDPLPQRFPKQLSPGIPGLSVDNPPPNERAATNLSEIMSTAWVPPDPLPTLPRNLSPGIPGMSVDPPPSPMGFSIYVTPDDMPVLPRPYVVQGAAAAAVQTPYVNTWLWTVIQSWAPLDGPPSLPRLLNPSITAVTVNNPPFSHLGRTVWSADIANRAWQPPDPLPTLANKLSPINISVTVNNPPFSYLGRDVWAIDLTFRAWIPPDPPPTLAPKLPPAISAVPVNNPPFSHLGRDVWAIELAARSWQVPDPLPTLPRPLVPQGVMVFVPFSIGWLPGVIGSWTPEPPRPILIGKMSPGIPGMSADPPPPSRTRPDVTAWQPGDPLPTLRKSLSPGIPGQSVDNPPAGTARLDVGGYWPAVSFMPTLLAKIPQGVRTDNPPFGHAGRSAITALATLAWQPPDPPPVQRGPLPPTVIAVPVNNPPFAGGSRTPLTVLISWLPPLPQPIIVPPSAVVYPSAASFLRFDPRFLTVPRARREFTFGRPRAVSTSPISPRFSMPRGNDFSPIDPSETVNGTWDFAPWLPSGRTIAAIVSTACDVIVGADPSSSTRLIGLATITTSPTTGAASSAVLQQWGTMLAGVMYRMTAVVLTSDGQTLTLYGHELCTPPN